MVDYIGRALVAEALQEWREQLQELASVSPLRDLALSETTTVDLRGSHPGGLAPLFAGRPTSLSSLLRDPDQYAAALADVRAIREEADRVKAATGVWTAALVIGTVAWTEDGHRRELPLVMRPVHFEPARQGDVLLTMLDDVTVNPVFLAEARAREADAGLAGLAPQAGPGVEFDPRPLWSRVRELGEAFPDVAVDERLFVGAFDDPEQRLLDDLDDMDAVLGASDVLAATAGDRDAQAMLAQPLPAFPVGDRDPFGERGVGDLDDAEFASLDLIATGRSLFLQAPPGADPVGTVAAIVADAAASGRAVMAVGGSEQAVRAVARRLDRLHVEDAYVSGAVPSWNEVARRRLLTSMTMGVDEFEDESLREVGEALLSARHELQVRLDALHRSHRPWDVSAYEAVQAVVRLISTEPAPRTQQRLGAEAAALVAEHGFASVTAAIMERLRPEPAAQEPAEEAAEEAVTLVPWWSEVTKDREEGARLDEALATLVVRHLPKMRAEAEIAAHQTGMDEATTIAAWADQVSLFTDLRDTLEIFSPAVFHRSLHDLVAATAPPGSPQAGSMPRRDRRALRRRAIELLRPGRDKDRLHEHLVAAHEQALRWRAHCSAGGWPLVPDDFDLYADRIENVLRLWSRLAEPILAVSGEEDLFDEPWDRVREILDRLAEGVPGTLEAVEEMPVERDLETAGLGALIDELRAADATADVVRRELEFAWWASAFDAIVSAEPRLTEEGALGRVVEEFLRRDRDFGEARVGPLMRAVAERRRIAIARHPEFARDLFATLVEGADAPYRDLWRDFQPLVSALRPITLATAEQVSRLAPPSRCVDLAVVFASESLALAETVPTLTRARQVVVVADAERATRSAVTAFAQLLPKVELQSLPQPRDPRVTGVLSSLAYGRALRAIPAAGDPDGLRVTMVEARGDAADPVETTAAEVAAAIDRADAVLHELPPVSVAIIAGNETHAAALRAALEGRGARLAAGVSVVALGHAADLEVDEVILSPGYARAGSGDAPSRLGALSEDGGAQALIQAIVASRARLSVVTALDADALGEADGSRGVDGLRELVIAADSAAVPAERPEPAPGDWLLADIASRLRTEGLSVRLRYGAGADAIPLVVGGADDGGYRVAVVTDESARTGTASVRDRMRHQYASLEALGWTVVSLWTLDVFMDPESAVSAIVAAVEGHREPIVWEQPALDLGVETSQIRVPVEEVFDLDAEPTGAVPVLRVEPKEQAHTEAPVVEAPDVTLGISVMLAEQLLVDKHDTEAIAIQAELDLEGDDAEEAEVEEAEVEDETADEPTADEAPNHDADQDADDAAEPDPAPASSLPSPPPIRPASRGTGRPLIPTRAREDMDEGWGGSHGSSRDDEIKRERPPHW